MRERSTADWCVPFGVIISREQEKDLSPLRRVAYLRRTWVSFALFALSSPWGWIGLLSPALIFYFLLKVTGIPATEAQALRSRGEEYRHYQETTSAFFPWFPRRVS